MIQWFFSWRINFFPRNGHPLFEILQILMKNYFFWSKMTNLLKKTVKIAAIFLKSTTRNFQKVFIILFFIFDCFCHKKFRCNISIIAVGSRWWYNASYIWYKSYKMICMILIIILYKLLLYDYKLYPFVTHWFMNSVENLFSENCTGVIFQQHLFIK